MAREDSGAGTVVVAFVLGAITGAAVALLVAPATGEETRRMLAEKAREGREKAGEAARQGREPLGFEHLPHCRRAEREPALLEGRADLVDRVVPFAQGDDGLAGGGLLELDPGPRPHGGKEHGRGLAPEVMTHHMEGARRVPEGPGHLGGGPLVDVVRAQGLVLTLLGRRGVQEHALACA